MNIKKWLHANQFVASDWTMAEGMLMSSPRAQRPSGRAVKKMLGRLMRGDEPAAHGWSSWRKARAV